MNVNLLHPTFVLVNIKEKFKFDASVLWFQKGNESHLEKYNNKWFGPYKIQYMLHNNMVSMVTLINFEPNLMLVNINKL
jgi:hypothetical protein